MTDFSDFIEPLKRELAIPGEFATVFPNTSDDDLLASLADGFGEAQLQGFFGHMALTTDAAGIITVDPDLSAAGAAIVLMFTGMRIIRAQLRAILTSERYKAGPTEFEIARSTNLLRDELAFMKGRLEALIADAKAAARGAAGTSAVFDNYVARNSLALSRLGGLYSYEFANWS